MSPPAAAGVCVNSIADDIDQIDARRLERVPTAVAAISKSDLIAEALGIVTARFGGPEASPEQWVSQNHDVSTMIRNDLFGRPSEGGLTAAIRRCDQASLQLVAALGSQPGSGERVAVLQPSRVTDPLYSVLDRLLEGHR